MREQWAEAFAERARAYWTAERTAALVDGKRLAVLPGEAPVLLRALGLLHRDGSMPPAEVRKFLQINHMIAVLKPSLRALRERCAGRPVRLLDAGCGRSYLTMVLAWVFVHRFEHPVELLGVDRSAALIETCRERTALCGLDAVLRYEAAPLEGFDPASAWRRAFGDAQAGLDGVIALHACDTATDDAIALGVAGGASLVAVAPCCQAELARRWASLAEAGVAGAFSAVWGSPHLRRTTAAGVTDAMRLQLLRAAGFEASAIEFVASAHTPRNTLIRAVRSADGPDAAALAGYQALREATGGCGIALEARLGLPAP